MTKKIFFIVFIIGILAVFLIAFIPKNPACDSIQNKSLKSQCESSNDKVVQAQFLFNDVLLAFDIGRCATIPVDYLATGCAVQLKKAGINGPIPMSDQLILQQAFSANDLFACNGFKTEGLTEYCMQTVAQEIQKSAYKRIIEIGDATNCKNLKNKALKERCFAKLGTPSE